MKYSIFLQVQVVLFKFKKSAHSMNNSFNPFVVLSKQQKKNVMKKIKTTAEQRQIGKKCNCFYKGKIYPCEVIGITTHLR